MKVDELAKALQRLAQERSFAAYAAVANMLQAAEPADLGLPTLRVAILRNFTIEPVLPVLTGEIALGGFHPQLHLGDYDALMSEVLASDAPVYAFRPDLVIVALWLETLAPELTLRFLSLSPAGVAAEIGRVLQTVDDLVTALRRRSQAPILLNNFPLPAYPTLGILDAQSDQYQAQAVLRLNQALLRRLAGWQDVYLVDYQGLVARLGSVQALDERNWQMHRAPLGRHALVPLGQEYGKYVRALRGRTRKCLVLDCDNTLWGGVVGEDGLAGLHIGPTYPGSCYQDFQRAILDLYDRGVILALCSKNNAEDVLTVLKSHSDMLLRERHFATYQLNWDDKATNLRRIAQDLNIGVDSLVLADDSEFECAWVRDQLPEVGVLHLGGDPSGFRTELLSAGYFDSLALSAEDRQRNQMYAQEAERRHLRAAASSLPEYLASLGLVAQIGQVDALSVARVAQLTQKTNQFNLTTRRYTEGEIRTLAADPQCDVVFLKLRDRIADLGLVGVAIVRYENETADIDSLLMSCRALARGAEQALLAHIVEAARSRGCARVTAHYRPTAKNGQVADFYGREGFALAGVGPAGSDWQLSLAETSYTAPAWIEVERSVEEAENASM